MPSFWQNLKIKIGLKRPPWPVERVIPIGPVSKLRFISSESYTLYQLYGNNENITYRYTWYSFIPKNLYEQAQRIANFYFLCLVIIQLYTDTPVSPAISIMPFVFVLALTAGKQGLEDYYRHKADREINNVQVSIVDISGGLKSIKSMDITVGDIVFCRANETFPCDMVLLSTSDDSGECFVTTASLDGETNLKQFMSVHPTRALNSSELFISSLRGTIKCEQPMADLYKFVGSITLQSDPKGDDAKPETVVICPLSQDNLLLRGARLRNTDYVFGCAVYTGKDTKMSMNSQEKTIKFSRVENKLNQILVLILLILILIALGYNILSKSSLAIKSNHWYVRLAEQTPWNTVQDFLAAIVLFNYIIPISLYVTIEFVKFFSTRLFNWDHRIYDERIDQPSVANTSDILEEMGQIEYIFSDKTGTLTENCMTFRRFAVASGSYTAQHTRIFKDKITPKNAPSNTLKLGKNADSPIIEVAEEDEEEEEEIPQTIEDDRLTLFLHIGLCHTIRVERPDAGENALGNDIDIREASELQRRGSVHRPVPRRNSSLHRRESAAKSASMVLKGLGKVSGESASQLDYQASSPDEKAFVEACRKVEVVYYGLDNLRMRVLTVGDRAVLRYRCLEVLEFDSDRKCMSVVLQPAPAQFDQISSYECVPSLPVVVLCKGAETAILAKLQEIQDHQAASSQVKDDLLLQSIFGVDSVTVSKDFILERVEEYAASGLRTLCMGARLLTASEWLILHKELNLARGCLSNRDANLSHAYGRIESQLKLVGCTGIEDKLQEGVPDTIVNLRKAGINFWILTGDKEETAVNISYSAGHFNKEMQEIRITRHTEYKTCAVALRNSLQKLHQTVTECETGRAPEFGVVIDGQSLRFCLEVGSRDHLLELVTNASSVLCCRLTPLQKAEVVRLIKNSRPTNPPITAAIGDGANDVSMILEAHVGFGLFGKEGRQAVRAADYAFGCFRFLERALLVHGHMIYARIALMIKYFFYKNIVFTFSLVLFGIYSGFSAQSMYAEVYLLFYNLTMTALPIMLYGVFEKPRPARALAAFPNLYRRISQNADLRMRDIVFWMMIAVWHSVVVFFGTCALTNFGDSSLDMNQMHGFGTTVVLTIFIVVTVKLVFTARYLNVALLAAILFTIVSNLSLFLIVNSVKFPVDTTAQMLGVWTELFTGLGCGSTYFGILIMVFVALLPDFVLRVYRDQMWVLNLDDLESTKKRESFLQLTRKRRGHKRKSIGLIKKDKKKGKMSGLDPVIENAGYDDEDSIATTTTATPSGGSRILANGGLKLRGILKMRRTPPAPADETEQHAPATSDENGACVKNSTAAVNNISTDKGQETGKAEYKYDPLAGGIQLIERSSSAESFGPRITPINLNAVINVSPLANNTTYL